MNKQEYFNFFQRCTSEMFRITKAKNADYTSSGDDPFTNFTRVEAFGICSTEQGFLTRMTDKMARIASIAQSGKAEVKDETVKDTLLDLANYSILFAAYLESKRPVPPLQPRMYVDDESEYPGDRTVLLDSTIHRAATEGTICLTQQELADMKERWLAP